MADAKRDGNRIATLLAVSSVDGSTPVTLYADPTTHRLLVDFASSVGTVTSVSVVSANGFAGSVATATTTPAITLSTTINAPVLSGNGTAIAAATTTGSGSTVVLATSPSLVTPVLGAATATSINGLTISTSTGTLTIANGSSLVTSGANSITLTSTGATNVTLPTSGTLATTTYVPTTITVADEATDTTCFPLFVTAATGDLGPKSNTNLTYNSNTGALSIGTSAAFTAGTIELGAASDTTISRSAAGIIAVEGVAVPTISSTDTLSNKTLTAPKFADLGYIADANGNELIILDTVTSAVNEVTLANAATGNNPTLTASGGDTNVGINYTAKGTGKHVFSGSVNFGAFTAYFTETDNGNSGASDTIDWTLSNKQKSTLTANCTFTFTAPPGPCSLILKLVQDATGSRTVTWPANVEWPAATAPTLTTTASRIDIITFYYDGSNYFGNSSLNFTV